MAVLKNGIQIKAYGDFANIRKNLMLLADVEVLAGFPEDKTDRESNPDEPAGLTNASLAYIHDNGAPEANIPARPFMGPAMEEARDKITAKLGQILTTVVTKGGNAQLVEIGMHQVGLIAKLAIQSKINEGIPPPLAEATLIARARKGRKGAKEELSNRKKGLPPSVALAKPLVDTGQMRNAADYAIRSRKKRRK